MTDFKLGLKKRGEEGLVLEHGLGQGDVRKRSERRRRNRLLWRSCHPQRVRRRGESSSFVFWRLRRPWWVSAVRMGRSVKVFRRR
jgi:hypothetical protein